MVTTNEILKTISEYDITSRNVIDFIFQGKKGDINHFYYRNMLLELLKTSRHLDDIIRVYYKLEQGSIFYGTYQVNINGKIEEKDNSETLQEAEKKIHTIYSQFERGEYTELKKILIWASEMNKKTPLLDTDTYDEYEKEQKINELMSRVEYLNGEKKKLGQQIQSNNVQDKKESKQITKSKQLTVIKEEKTIIHKIFPRFFHYLENRRRRKENNEIENQIADIQKKIDEKSNELKEIFNQMGADEFWDECNNRYEYYNGSITMRNVFNRLMPISSDWKEFNKDLLACSKIIQNDTKVLEKMNEGADLSEVCTEIRKSLKGANAINSSRGIQIDIRKSELGEFRSDGSFSPTLVKDLPEAFEKLSEEFKNAMEEKDDTEFVKKCADFHFDFLKVHPFSDGNGRTSRILLTTMLASHNLILPSLYIDSYGKSEFYQRSNDALKGNYATTEQDLFERLGHFYPSIIPDLTGKNEHIENKKQIGKIVEDDGEIR